MISISSMCITKQKQGQGQEQEQEQEQEQGQGQGQVQEQKSIEMLSSMTNWAVRKLKQVKRSV